MADELRQDPGTGDVTFAGTAPVSPPTPSPPAPEGAWERLYVALTFGVENPLLAPLGDVLLAELRNPWTMITFAGILAVWAGAQFTPFAAPVDFAVGALGWAALGNQIISLSSNLYAYAKTAFFAKTEQDLRTAGTYLAAAIVEFGKDGVEFILSYGAFRAARAAVQGLKSAKSFTALRQPRAPERTGAPEGKPAEGPRAAENRPTERLFEERPPEEPPAAERPFEQRPPEEGLPKRRSSDERPGEKRPSEERPFEEGPSKERPFEERPVEERPGEGSRQKTRSERLQELLGQGKAGALGGAEQLGEAAEHAVGQAVDGIGLLLVWLLGGASAFAILIALLRRSGRKG